jgi:short-subunit dehydrogenase
MGRKVPLLGQRIVITGGGGGIGRAAMSALEEKGAVVTGIDNSGAPEMIDADVRDRDAMVAAMADAAAHMGGIDTLINNAGIGRAHDSGDFPDDDARLVMDVNFYGAWTATAAGLPHLIESHGHVINVASGLAKIDLPYATAYSASKRALAAYSAALAIEYSGRLAVTTLYPGYIRTAIHDIPSSSGVGLDGLVRADTIEGAAAAIVKACERRPRSITTSIRSTAELWAAGRFPRSTERVLAARMRRWAKDRPVPPFLRYPDDRFQPEGS